MTANTNATVIVKTQEQLDRAIADGIDRIEIRAPKGLRLIACGSATVTAYDSSKVTACDSATAIACGSATVTAYDSATVTACGSATAIAYDSATVIACCSATVTAYDSSKVTACGSATAIAYDSATVIASDSATVTACGSSKVTAYDSATVHACDSATVTASSHSAVHIKSKDASITGGVQIDHTALDIGDAKVWCKYYGVRVIDGIAYLYKAVNDQWTTDRGWDYSPGSTPQAETWVKNGQCGDGLHFSPTPIHARRYYSGATRFVRVGVALEDLSPIIGGSPKAKAPRVVSPCIEVTLSMREVQS